MTQTGQYQVDPINLLGGGVQRLQLQVFRDVQIDCC